ncbi:MAG: MaoC family dehydratase [Janthinobacterium lividum]
MPVNSERPGNFFEDFQLGQVIRHATPRTMTEGDASLYVALTGARQALHSSTTAAALLGYPARPLDDLLVFNMAFGKTVPDISLNAIANLGYAEVRFLAPVYAGNTLHCESVILGLKENSSRKSGVVYVRSSCYDEQERIVLTWVRWVMINKRDPAWPAPEPLVPALGDMVTPGAQCCHAGVVSRDALDEWCEATGSVSTWEDFSAGQRIDHAAGMTIEEADHMCATRLYQNNARVHFDAHFMRQSAAGRRLVYGGHVISVCRALAYDGLENAICLLAINAGAHVAPTFAGDTLYAFTQVIQKWKLPGRADMGAVRLRLVGIKNAMPGEIGARHVGAASMATYHPNVVLDLDCTVLMPRRAGV